MNRLNSIVPPSLLAGFPPIPSLPFPNNFTDPPYDAGYSTCPSIHNVPQVSTQPSAPQPIPEIRTVADLALFNQFMISLGRDAAKAHHAPTTLDIPHNHSNGSHASASSGSSPLLSDQSPLEDLFNPEELASLGLTGMPGKPIPDVVPSPATHNTPIIAQSSYGLYPTLDNMHVNRARAFGEFDDISKRNIANLPRASIQSTPTKPQYLSDIYGLGPTQYAELPGFTPNGNMGHTALGAGEHHYASFDSLARSKSYVPPATLAPREFYKKTYRHVAPLGAAVSSRSRESAERTEMEEPESMDEEEAMTPKISVQSLLLSDDQADPGLKLPAIHSEPVEEPGHMVLPSVTEFAPPSNMDSTRPSSPMRQLPVKRHTEDEILRGVKRLELSEETRPREGRNRENNEDVRRRHVHIIRAWLVAVNAEFRRWREDEWSGQLERDVGEDEDMREREEIDERIGREGIAA